MGRYWPLPPIEVEASSAQGSQRERSFCQKLLEQPKTVCEAPPVRRVASSNEAWRWLPQLLTRPLIPIMAEFVVSRHRGLSGSGERKPADGPACSVREEVSSSKSQASSGPTLQASHFKPDTSEEPPDGVTTHRPFDFGDGSEGQQLVLRQGSPGDAACRHEIPNRNRHQVCGPIPNVREPRTPATRRYQKAAAFARPEPDKPLSFRKLWPSLAAARPLHPAPGQPTSCRRVKPCRGNVDKIPRQTTSPRLPPLIGRRERAEIVD